VKCGVVVDDVALGETASETDFVQWKQPPACHPHPVRWGLTDPPSFPDSSAASLSPRRPTTLLSKFAVMSN
jgi:hypothetical protein